MPRRAAGVTLSVPISNPRYTAVESQLTISPPYRSASVNPSALFPVAVGPRTATSVGRVTTSARTRTGRTGLQGPATRAAACASPGRRFVVVERDGEKRLVGWILRRQRLRRIGRRQRAERRVV